MHCSCLLETVSVSWSYHYIIQLMTCNISRRLPCMRIKFLPSSLLVLKPGVCHYQISSITELRIAFRPCYRIILTEHIAISNFYVLSTGDGIQGKAKDLKNYKSVN